MFYDMGGNTILEPHISEFGGRRIQARASSPVLKPIILILNGDGFSIAGKEDLLKNYVKIDWQRNSIVSPPYFWYHQHFNTGTTPARYFAVTEGDFPKRLGIPLEVEQIEATREDPAIRKLFDEELAKKKEQGLGRPGTRDQGPGTRDQGTRDRDQEQGSGIPGPRARDQWTSAGAQGPGTRDQG